MWCRYLIGCDNELGRLHMRDPSVCDKVGGFIVMHIDDLRKFAPLWLLKTEEVRADKERYGTNITGDIYGKGWISEMYGYSFGASDVSVGWRGEEGWVGWAWGLCYCVEMGLMSSSEQCTSDYFIHQRFCVFPNTNVYPFSASFHGCPHI